LLSNTKNTMANCNGNRRRLCSDDNCDNCLNNSFASNPKVEFWSNKNKLKPRQVFKSSGSKYIFDCTCGHEFNTALSKITNSGRWCPYCANQKLCSDDNCDSCLNKSFASSPKVEFWSNKNKLKPRQVFKSSGSKYIFDCECGHEFNTRLDSITNSGAWCPLCKNKTEKKLFIHLKQLHPNTQHQFSPSWCKNADTNRRLPFDFVIKELKIIIELDGAQHFKQVSNWGCPKEACVRDKFKMDHANKNNYTVIRILQEDVFNDRNEWDTKLNEVLKLYPEPTRIFIGGDEYDNHKQE